jgi:hypothetical protein
MAETIKKILVWLGMILFCLFFWVAMIRGCANAEEWQDYSNEQIANAIFKAENSKAHPYGIMTKYKHTTPRQACINTIKTARRLWNGKGDFISFLQKRYAPIGVSNDPKGLNRYWAGNVKAFLVLEIKYGSKR